MRNPADKSTVRWYSQYSLVEDKMNCLSIEEKEERRMPRPTSRDDVCVEKDLAKWYLMSSTHVDLAQTLVWFVAAML